jgi:hypothetical protein
MSSVLRGLDPIGTSPIGFEFGDLAASRAPLLGLGLRCLGALGLPASLSESFSGTSGSMSLGALHNL